MAIDISNLDVCPALAKEELTLKRILDNAKTFYQDPKNRLGYEAWLKNQNKEALINVTNNTND